MIGYYENAIATASLLLHELRGKPENLSILLDLQGFLVQKIRRSERNVLRLKSSVRQLKVSLRRDRLRKEQATTLKKKIKTTSERAERYKHLIFIWKCFGDGIANIYCSKYALKHALYSVDDYTPKEGAGFLIGKEGFRLELEIVRKVIGKGGPILLCDITNVLRHGDVCLMLSDDPILIEVKSSKNQNERGARQLQHLQALQKFFAEDCAVEFRGLQYVQRQEFMAEEVNHTDVLNMCIERSYIEGTAIVSPEPGVHYLAISGKLDTDKLPAVLTDSSAVFMLNEAKSESAWMPYYPFTLSLQPQHLYHFIRGSLYLIVVIDLKVLKSLFRSNGVHATVVNDGVWFLQISKDRTNLNQGVWRISEQMFLRIPFEFQSMTWFVKEASRFPDMGFGDPGSMQGPPFEVPASWFSVSDDLDD